MNDFIFRAVSKKDRIKRRLAFGVGINDADYVTQPKVNGKQVTCPYYQRWISVVSRCYDPRMQAKHKTYRGCYMTDEWLYFSAFKLWMEKQDWQGKQLDKDILSQGNKVYSPEACVFVNQSVNKLLINRAAERGDCKQGVTRSKTKGKFISQVKINGKREYLGLFNTEKEAFAAYCKAKYTHIANVANEQDDERVKEALLSYEIKG